MAALRNLKPLLKSLPSDAISLLHNADTHIPRTLYETLARLPRDGVGARVFQTRWQSKGIQGCYWEVTKVTLKDEGKHGKAWGKLVWRGRPVSEGEERIRGALKYMWVQGVSRGSKLKAFPVEEGGSTTASTGAKTTAKSSSPSKQSS